MLLPNSLKSCRSVLTRIKPLKNARGFTLIEVLISTVILATALVLIVQNLARTQDTLRVSQNLVTATEIGVSKLSAIEVEQQEKIRLSVRRDQGKEKIFGRPFQWESEIAPYRDITISDETKLNQGRVSVQWMDGKTRKNSLQFNTLFLAKEKKKNAPATVTPAS